MSMTRLDQCVPPRVRKPLSQIFLTSLVWSFSKRSFQALLIFFVRMKLRKHRFVQNSENIDLFKTHKTSICSKLRKHRFVQNSQNIDLFKAQKTSICSKLRKHRFVQNATTGWFDLFRDDEEWSRDRKIVEGNTFSYSSVRVVGWITSARCTGHVQLVFKGPRVLVRPDMTSDTPGHSSRTHIQYPTRGELWVWLPCDAQTLPVGESKCRFKFRLARKIIQKSKE